MTNIINVPEVRNHLVACGAIIKERITASYVNEFYARVGVSILVDFYNHIYKPNCVAGGFVILKHKEFAGVVKIDYQDYMKLKKTYWTKYISGSRKLAAIDKFKQEKQEYYNDINKSLEDLSEALLGKNLRYNINGEINKIKTDIETAKAAAKKQLTEQLKTPPSQAAPNINNNNNNNNNTEEKPEADGKEETSFVVPDEVDEDDDIGNDEKLELINKLRLENERLRKENKLLLKQYNVIREENDILKEENELMKEALPIPFEKLFGKVGKKEKDMDLSDLSSRIENIILKKH